MPSPALLIIDVQKGFDSPYWGERNNPDAEKNMVKLLQCWRDNQGLIIHIQHCSTEPNSPLHPSNEGNAFKKEMMPIEGEKCLQKSVNSAFIGTGLEDYLHSQKINDLVIAGLTTDHCVSTTTRMAGNLGFNVLLAHDATATFGKIGYNDKQYTADEIHHINLASLHNEFCTVMSTHDIIHYEKGNGDL